MIGIELRQRRISVLSDVELARAAQNGDAASLGALLERHDPPLYALALRILGRGPEAQDAVQDAFLIALSSHRPAARAGGCGRMAARYPAQRLPKALEGETGRDFP